MSILETIQEIKEITEPYVDATLYAELNELKVKITEQRLYVVMVGLFKRGKSTLLNVLMEKDLLPASVIPVTALVTIVEYAEKQMARIYFSNDEILTISASEIDEYVTEEKNPNNQKQVRYVHLFDNAPILKHLSLVDTPGLGSAFEHNTQTTLSFIPKIDAALFLLSADIPVSKIDLELLQELKQHVQKIYFVFNKADLISDNDLQKLVQHNKTILAEAMKQADIHFYVVSGKQPDKYYFNELKAALQQLGFIEKDIIIQASVQRQLNLAVRQAIMQMQLRSDALLMPLHELEAKQQMLQSSIRLMNEQKEEFDSIIGSKIKTLQLNIHKAINDESKALEETINRSIEAALSNGEKLNNIKSIQQENDQLLLQRFTTVKEEWELKTKEQFSVLLQQYSQRSKTFLYELTNNLKAFSTWDFEMISGRFNLDAYTSFYLTLDSGNASYTASNNLLRRVFPDMYNRKLSNGLQQHYKQIITRNTASVIYDLSYKIQESFRRFSYDLNGRMNELLQNMQKIVEEVMVKYNSSEKENEPAINKLQRKLATLKQMITD